jgi:hypothetical protein
MVMNLLLTLGFRFCVTIVTNLSRNVLKQRNARGSDIRKHFWNIKMTGHPLGEVLKTVTSQHYQLFTNIVFYEHCGINHCPINSDIVVHEYRQVRGADQLPNTLSVCGLTLPLTH